MSKAIVLLGDLGSDHEAYPAHTGIGRLPRCFG